MLKTVFSYSSNGEGFWVPNTTLVKGETFNSNYLFLQNDTATNRTSPWYVKKLNNENYTMPNAKAPKGSQYIGVFIREVSTDSTISRADSTAIWTSTDSSVVKIHSITSSGQAIINISAPGVSTLKVTWKNLSSSLIITAS